MKSKITVFALCAMLFALCGSVDAQQTKKIVQIGYLSPRSEATSFLAFKEGLRELGWVEGKQVKFEYRYAGDQLDKLTNFATELVRLGVDVIVTGPGNGAAIAAKRATTTIPIVMVMVVDPVSNGLVASLARPGANVTGLTFDVTQEQAGKNLELLKEAVPKVSRVAVLRNPNFRFHRVYSKEAERAAKILGVTIQFAEMQALNDKNLEDALSAVVRERANALLVTPQPFFVDRRQQIINFATRHKLPAIYFSSGFVDAGGLMSYGPNGEDPWRRAATYVDKILKGRNPADLPVEQPMKFELVINLKTAQQIGVTIPQSLLYRADKVIKGGE
jgi:putative tryptophan/tyrosine transport system substrate-binding protein